MKTLNDITYQIIGGAYKAHSELGPGLLESTYEICMAKELDDSGLKVEIQKPLPVVFKKSQLSAFQSLG